MAEPVIRFAGITDVGRRRNHNEDAYFFSDSDHYCMIADGMGGRMYGEVAANMTVDLLREKFETFFPRSMNGIRTTEQNHVADMVVTLLDEWIRDVNFAVWKKGQSDDKYREMGTTLVFAYTLPKMAVVAHVGDSRIYHLAGETLTQVTSDHSLVNSQVADGLMTEEEAQASTQKNIITRAIGTGKNVKPEFESVHLKRTDRLLLCSDGLTDMVEDEVIRDILLDDVSPDDALAALVNEANQNGGRDNITIVLVDYD